MKKTFERRHWKTFRYKGVAPPAPIFRKGSLINMLDSFNQADSTVRHIKKSGRSVLLVWNPKISPVITAKYEVRLEAILELRTWIFEKMVERRYWKTFRYKGFASQAPIFREVSFISMLGSFIQADSSLRLLKKIGEKCFARLKPKIFIGDQTQNFQIRGVGWSGR